MGNHSKAFSRGICAFAALGMLAFALALAAGPLACQAAFADTALSAQSTVTTVPNGPGDADNMRKRAAVDHVFRFGWQDDREYFDTKATVKTLDITGDGDPDTIKVAASKTSNSAFLTKIKIYVNGKKKKTVSLSGIDRATVDVVTLKNNKPFLWVSVVRKNGKASQALYRYEDGALEKAFSNAALNKKNTSNSTISNLSLSGNKIDVTFSFVSSVTGVTKAIYTYKYEDGELERTSNTTKRISYATKSNGNFTNDKVTVAGKFAAYEKSNLKTKAFTAKVGKKAQPVSVTISGKKLLYKVKYGKKTGWIECPKIKKQSKRAPYTMFYETYGKVNLKTSVPSYSADKYFKASDLQLYSNHSLFIARNEILARAVGKSFASVELSKYFKAKSWYKSKKGRPLTDAENANLNLILSIEKARGSLYV